MMKSIKMQVIAVIACLTIFLGLCLGALSSWLNYQTATGVLKQSFTELATISADQVAAEIKIIQNAAVQTGIDAELANPNTSLERQEQIISNQAALYGFTRGNLLKSNGDSYFDGNNYAERDYFKAAMQGNAFISDPTLSKVTGKVSFLVAAPVWENGVANSRIVGVIYFVPDENFLNKLMENINPSPSGYGYIINKNGTTVADVNRDLVAQENSIEQAKTDPSLTEIANIDRLMIQGETGFGTHRYEGTKCVQGYAPIAYTDGWSLGVMANESDFLGSFYLALMLTVGLTALFTIGGVIFAIFYAKRLTTPLRICSERIRLLSEGDLTTEIQPSNRKDELGVLQNSTHDLCAKLSDMVDDLRNLLREIAGRNLDVAATAQYGGDFAPLKTASEGITDSLNQAIRQIQQSALQVKTGAEQVSSGAQSLSQGATEQASSIQELSATISEITVHIKNSAENASKAKVRSEQNGTDVAESNRQMQEMIEAMGAISEKSGEINKIVKTIEDIAFQTNILALNAAVEAARAGAAGKGFAVVADEVRNLAGKSAIAAKNTTVLIEETVQAVQQGTTLAGATAAAMQGVVTGSGEICALIEEIATASSQQATAVEQVSQGVEQISAVVQNNSATSEQSAAASEELTGQAVMMEQLVAKFQLKREKQSAQQKMDDSIQTEQIS